MRVSRSRLLVAGLLIAGLTLGACRSEAASPVPPAATRLETTPTSTPTPAVAPLTGERATPDVLNRPVVAVKIENSPAARPQAGLEAADVVYEELTEGGITRFAALFHSRVPQLIGPIRSGRPEDANVLPAYRPVLFLSGARREVFAQFAAVGLTWRDDDGKMLYRDRSRRAPHNVFGAGADLFGFAQGRVPRAAPTGWLFTPGLPAGAVLCRAPCREDPGRSVTVRMSHTSVSRFDYDPTTGRYRRFQDGRPMRVTGPGRVGAANVLVLAMAVRQAGCCDSAGNPLQQTQVLGGGRAVVLRDGKRYEGTWWKNSPASHYQVTVAGLPFAFKPGPTWTLLAPADALR